MARRLTTAAGLVCAVALIHLVLCVVATTPGNGDPLALLKSLTPVSIVYKKDKSLCVGVASDNTTVVLVRTIIGGTFLEKKEQLWFMHRRPSGSGSLTADGVVNSVLTAQPFALVSFNSVFAGQPRAILTPSNSSYFLLQLAPYDITNVPKSMLWIQGNKSSNFDPFTKIKLFSNQSWVLDGWEMSTQTNATVAVYPATHNEANIFWWPTQIFDILA